MTPPSDQITPMESKNKSIYTHKYNGVNLTKKQYDILMYIKSYRKENGIAPSFRDISLRFNLAGITAVICHVKTLRKKNLISWTPGMARTLQLTDTVAVDVPTQLVSEVKEFISKRMKELKCEK